jgi:hypothetical protein
MSSDEDSYKRREDREEARASMKTEAEIWVVWQ